MSEDYLKTVGVTALGSRLRRLLDRLNGPVTQLYRDELGFEQRWFALLMLLGEKGRLRIGDAAAALGVSHVAIVHSVAEMRRAGLLTKKRDATDRRVSLITLTKAGEAMLGRVTIVSARVDAAARALLEDAAPELIDSLDRLDAALGTEGFAARLDRAGQPVGTEETPE